MRLAVAGRVKTEINTNLKPVTLPLEVLSPLRRLIACDDFLRQQADGPFSRGRHSVNTRRFEGVERGLSSARRG